MSRLFLHFKLASTTIILLVLLSGKTQLVSAVHGLFQDDMDLEFLASPKFSSDWAVELTEGEGGSTADQLARKYGFTNLGQIGNLRNFYHFKLMANISDIVHQVKARSIGSWKEISEQPHLTHALKQNNGVGFVEQQQIVKHSRMSIYSKSTDPLWPNQWTLFNTGQTEGPSGKDLNVEPVWMQGVTGSGAVVGFVDNGLEKSHPDLSHNYDSRASWDFVNTDADPTPDNYFGDEPDSHGTECAGMVGMVKDNGECGVGIAYNCHIGGLKVDLSFMTDIIEADAFGHNHNYIDVHSNSWGLASYGFGNGGPKTLARKALETGAKEGRNKKGVIYTFACGNYGQYSDSCAVNGYVSSIYTIAVGSANQNGEQASYDEQCAAKMVVTFALNSDTIPHPNDDWKAFKQVTTTTLNGQCTDRFSGTSASTPHVSGAIALALQANPNLTWRDVQYLLAYTSNPDSLLDGEWTVNGGGLKVSHKFGFGAVDAEALVTRARRWINVPEQKTQTIIASQPYNLLPFIYTTAFYVTAGGSISFLEHVVVTTTLEVNHNIYHNVSYADIVSQLDNFNGNYYKLVTHLQGVYAGYPKRGDIKIELTSPQGTVSTMLPYRINDFINEEGYDNKPFMSVHHWGENPVGQWIVKVYFISASGSVSVNGLNLTLYGTQETPQAVSTIPTLCNVACARDCSGPRALDCDACREYRISSTLECVSTCPQESTIEVKNGYCLDGSTPTSVPNEDTTSNSLDHLVIIASGAGGGALLLLILLVVGCGCLVFCCRKKSRSYRAQGFAQLPSEGSNPVPV